MVKGQPSARPARPLGLLGPLPMLHCPLALLENAGEQVGSAWPALANYEPGPVPSSVCPWAVHRQRGEEPQISLSQPHLMPQICPAAQVGREIKSFKLSAWHGHCLSFSFS